MRLSSKPSPLKVGLISTVVLMVVMILVLSRSKYYTPQSGFRANLTRTNLKLDTLSGLLLQEGTSSNNLSEFPVSSNDSVNRWLCCGWKIPSSSPASSLNLVVIEDLIAKCQSFDCATEGPDNIDQLVFDQWTDDVSCQLVNCFERGRVCFVNKSGNHSCREKSSIVHLVMLADRNVSGGLLTTLHSIIKNTRTSVVKIYIVTNHRDVTEFERIVGCISLPEHIMIEVIKFDLPQSVKDLILIHGSSKQYLKSTENFARLFLDRLLSSLDYVLYVDCDTIIKGDLGEFWREVYRTKQLMAVVSYGKLKQSGNRSYIYEMRNGKKFGRNAVVFNNGVLGINLKKWRDKNVLKEVLFWMAVNKEYELWHLGTQPIMNILGVNDVKLINQKWNYRMYQNNFSVKAAIYHLNGPCKPWKNCTMKGKKAWKNLWKKYDKGLCSKNGQCILENSTGTCECNEGYSGHYCENKSTG